jgi:branched-chain amino acid transport system substrate-binding protein
MADALVQSQPDRSKPRRLTRRAAIIGMALLMAGCQSIVPRGERPTGPQGPAPTGPGTVTPDLPTDTERHRIALLLPMSGSNAGVGQSIANAANLAVLDTGGQRIRITTYDTATGAGSAAQRAVADGNKLILGPLLADDVRLVTPHARRANVPILSFSNDSSVAGNGTFVMGYTPVQSIDRVVRHARSKGMTKFAGLMPSGVYGQRASTALIRSVESAGGQVVTMQTFDRSQRSLSGAITRMGSGSGYDAVLIADGGRIAMQAAPLIRKGGGADAQILGTELWNTETGLSANAAMRGAWFASVPDGLYRQMAAKYRARYGNAPYRISSLGYDAVLLVSRIARDWKVGSNFPVRQLTDEGGFGGIDGAFRFGDDGIAERSLEVKQVGAGGITVVSPAPKAFGK